MLEILVAALITPPQDIEGLIHVHKPYRWYSLRRPKIFEYKLENGGTFNTPVRLRKIKDIRPYQEAHPKRHALQGFCARWEPVIGVVSGASNVAWAGLSKYRGGR